MDIARQIIVFGKVQGVGFRYYAKQKAEELKLKGFIQNEKDGSVCIKVMGNDYIVKQFIDWCRIGPQWAQVVKVHLVDLPIFKTEGFSIK